jgi:hypothetical protein
MYTEALIIANLFVKNLAITSSGLNEYINNVAKKEPLVQVSIH